MTKFATVADALAHVAKKRAASRTKTAEKQVTLADGVKLFKDSFEQAMIEYFPKVPRLPLSPTRQVPLVKNKLIKPFRQSGVSIPEFVDYTVSNWTNIRVLAFKGFRYYPDYPTVDWLLKFIDKYLAEFISETSNPVPQEPVITKQKPDQIIAKIVHAAKATIKQKDRELAKLRDENKRLRSRNKTDITVNTAKTTNKIPDWE